MRATILFFAFLLIIITMDAQVINLQNINNLGNRSQTYPKVEAINPEIQELVSQVSVSNLESSIRWMQNIGIRAAETLIALQTQEWLVSQFESFGLDVYTHHFPWYGNMLDAGNVIAIQYGTEFPDEYIIVSSHYDHPDGPGADDNASGTAGVLEIARILSQHSFKRTIMYIPFNAEEYWMVGSLPFAEKCAQEDMSILGCFNLDMLGFFPKSIEQLTMYSGSSFVSDRLWQYYENVANLYVPDIPTRRFSVGDAYGGDHIPFNIYEYPALYIGDIEYIKSHPCYHRSCDTIGAGVNNMELVQAFTRATLAAVSELADGWLAPQKLRALPGDGKITISWCAAPETSVYRLYRNDQLLTETTDTLYVNHALNNGTEYTYYVKGVHIDTGEESAESNRDIAIASLPLQIPYFNDFEANMDDWICDSDWNLNGNIKHSGEYSFVSNLMNSMADNYLTIAELQWFSIPATVEHVSLSFYVIYNIVGYGIFESGQGYVEVTKDRKSWQRLIGFKGMLNEWILTQVSLDDYIGEDFVQIRFRLESIGEETSFYQKYMGIDDFTISYSPIITTPQNVEIQSYHYLNNVAIIQWERMSSEGYNIYRDGKKLNNNPIPYAQYSYRDNSPSPRSCYQLTALFPDGESDFSESACIQQYGIENIILSDMSIFPNPSSGQFCVTTGLIHPYSVIVYTMDGMKVFQQEYFVDGILDLSFLSAGTYILKINSQKEGIAKRIIIQ